MSFKTNDKELSKIIIRYGKELKSKPVYGDDDNKYIKTKINICKQYDYKFS